MSKRFYDETFKRMAVDLSYAKGNVKQVAEELGIDPGRISKWRQRESTPKEKSRGLNRRTESD